MGFVVRKLIACRRPWQSPFSLGIKTSALEGADAFEASATPPAKGKFSAHSSRQMCRSSGGGGGGGGGGTGPGLGPEPAPVMVALGLTTTFPPTTPRASSGERSSSPSAKSSIADLSSLGSSINTVTSAGVNSANYIRRRAGFRTFAPCNNSGRKGENWAREQLPQRW